MGNKKRSPILNCLRSMTPQPGRQPKKLTARKFPKPSIHRVTTKTKWKIRPPSQILVCLDQQRMKKMNGTRISRGTKKPATYVAGFCVEGQSPVEWQNTLLAAAFVPTRLQSFHKTVICFCRLLAGSTST